MIYNVYYVILYYIIVYYILYTALYVITYNLIITIINIKYYNNTIIHMIYNYTGYFLLLR